MEIKALLAETLELRKSASRLQDYASVKSLKSYARVLMRLLQMAGSARFNEAQTERMLRSLRRKVAGIRKTVEMGKTETATGAATQSTTEPATEFSTTEVSVLKGSARD